ncbi:GNAT family N-acetyltransferase [Pasteurella atlantica]|uniref:GNAT family N-acetyltransferase n=2 Tax=Pasteurellaceae TaxID=712 RepID=A0ACC6HPV2_9PAST|nr:GNAT family N-acetyltransferase [Pasteurella atlantica]MDP8052858.1 GNAT family N-acetyltransferase [Pasteurella atlantica]MDP8102081.1 GNAT family N-acetyltransferase [Pasteurella atlantica]MDP8106121.1 GNAT family N-acetyltransferase [Pasteurella atlantica]MDP8149513.1 GNAT family N-acetyltransferase [Pasteurella atlantica]
MIEDCLDDIDIIPLSELRCNKKTFNSHSLALNHYFHKQASQDEKKNLSKCFVLINEERIIGYYTLSATSVGIHDIPKENIKKEIRYPNIPAVLLGRLAIDKNFLKQGYGKFLVADAIYKAKNTNLGVALLIVDAKDDEAITFYKKLGFIQFMDKEDKLFFPLTKLIK